MRLSIYIQTTLYLIPGVPALIARAASNDKERTEVIVTGQLAMLLTGFALVFSAFIQKGTGQLTVYHSLIVLNFVWMISLVCNIAAAVVLAFKITAEDEEKNEPEQRTRSPSEQNSTWLQILEFILPDRIQEILPTYQRFILLASVHMTFMSMLGILLFSDPLDFDQANPDCTLITKQVFFGAVVPASSVTFSFLWLTVYAICLLPVMNLIATIVVQVACFFLLPVSAAAITVVSWPIISTVAGYILTLLIIPLHLCGRVGKMVLIILSPIGLVAEATVKDALSVVSFITLSPPFIMLAALLLNILFIASTEATIKINHVQSGENDWTFGQTISLLVIVPAIYSAYGDLIYLIKIVGL